MECLPRHAPAEPGFCQSSKMSVLTLDACFDIEEIKRGRYSVISKACCNGMLLAIKTYDRPSLVPKKQKMATREAIVLKYLNSQGVPNITHMWSAYASQDKFHILMEFCSGGNLLERLKSAAGPMTEQQLAATVAAPLLRTLTCMHAAGVVHRDIKLENIFMDAHGHPKLGDFDLAVFHHEAPARSPVGTIFYMAPEVLLLAGAKGTPMEVAIQRRVSEKMDVWSLGVCLFELAAGYKPFQGVSYEGIASAIIQAAMADLPHHLSSSFRSFIAAALTYDPVQRPSAQQLLDHPWIQVNSPAAIRSDSACSLLDIGHNGIKQQCPAAMQQQRQHLQPMHVHTSSKSAAVAAKHHMAAASFASLEQQQVHLLSPRHHGQHSSSSGGCSSSDIVSGSSCSGHSSSASSCCSSGSAMMKCTSRDVGPCSAGATMAVAAVAVAGMVGSSAAGAGAAWLHQQPLGSSINASASAAPSYAVASTMHGLPGLRLRNNSSLGTQFGDWSTTDSSATCCSPHSIMHRMGLSSSGMLGKQLMPWASAGSSAAGHNMITCGEGAHAHASYLPQQQQQQSMRQSTQHSCSSQVVLPPQGTSTNTPQQQHQQQQQPLQQQCGPGGTANGKTPAAVTQQAAGYSSSNNKAVASPAGSSSHCLPQQQHGAPSPAGQRGTERPGAPCSSSSSSAAVAPPSLQRQQQQQQQAAIPASPKTAAAAAAAAAAASSHMSPLALAVAAAVAEHNKQQPRMWTPFALRVHQLRVAQVLLAERQKVGSQPPAPPPAQPLMPLQATRLPAVSDDEPEQQQQQQHRKPDAHVNQAARDSHPQQQQQQRPAVSVTPPQLPAQQVHNSTPAVHVLPAQAVHQSVQPRGGCTTAPRSAADATSAPSAAVPGSADAMMQPLVHQMQQQLSIQTGAAAVSSAGGRSSAGSSAADASKPVKPAKKTWLACFVPRAFE